MDVWVFKQHKECSLFNLRAQMLTDSLLEKSPQLASQILAASTLREGVAEDFPCSAYFPGRPVLDKRAESEEK